MMTSYFYTKDHPRANGRIPLPGEHTYSFTFPLQDGNDLVVYCGEETLHEMKRLLIDNAADTA